MQQVKIIKCNHPEFWYNKYIGVIFKVIGNPIENNDLYQVIDMDKSNSFLYLMKCDVMIITREMKFERILK